MCSTCVAADQGEDFHGDPGALPPPEIRDTAALRAELLDIECTAAPPVARRVRMRRLLLELYEGTRATVPKPGALGVSAAACAQCWAQIAPELCATSLVSAPRAVQPFFDVTLSRKLTMHIPLRPVAPPDRAATAEMWTRVLGVDFPLALRILDTDCVFAWHELVQTNAVGGTLSIPFVRSLMCTFMSNGVLVAGGRCELEHLVYDPVESTCGVSVEDALVRLEWHARHHGNQHDLDMSLRLGRFVQRFAGLVAPHLAAFVQNPARGRRMLGKAYAAWADLADIAAELDDRLADIDGVRMPSDALHKTVQHFALTQLRHVVCAGFELELYGYHEWACMYWLAAEICDEHALLCEELDAPFARVRAEARVLREIFRALAHVRYS